jgi:isoleucyl-tRNA synthetase
VGLAFHPTEYYVVLKTAKGDLIVAEKLSEAVAKKVGGGKPLVGRWQGKDFIGAMASNPLHGGLSQIVTATYVTMDDGTGVVHIAPGHGVEDFAVGQKFNLPTVCPVDERGRYDDSVGRADLVGKHVLKDANAAVIEALGANLLHHESFTHSYPHCWRCKNPIIFRATKQWFLMVSDEFRATLLKEIDNVKWEPDYGIHRIKGMVEQRPDWCLSRQRHWGAPIAVFVCTNCKEPLHNKEVDQKTVEMIRTQGASAWYAASVEELLKGLPSKCLKCGGNKFDKEMDILDVWFDSGVSWHAVVERNFSTPKPETIMYLEGSDQHRGWFQTSLIPATAINGKAPYDLVLTHGFVVDGKGHKMSKSMGNVIAPQEIIKQYGADVLRLWVGASDYREDVRLSQDIVKQSVEMYRKFRNTFRFLLQNTADFKFTDNGVAPDKLEEIDRWILVHFEDVKKNVIKAYEDYQFHVVLAELNRFVSVALSGFYLDAHKDHLYCEAVNSPKRRSAQTALYHLNHGLSVLLSPFLSFTAEEAYLEMKKVSNPALLDSVFIEEAANLVSVPVDEKLNAKWLGILAIRSQVNDVLDQERKAGKLKTSQEAAVHINPEKMTPENRTVLETASDWPFLLQMSEVLINGKDKADAMVRIEPTKNAKCERCWRFRPDVGGESKHPTLCKRCADVVS